MRGSAQPGALQPGVACFCAPADAPTPVLGFAEV